LHIFANIRMNLTTSPWKFNRSLLGRKLLITQYRTTMKSMWPVKPLRQNRNLAFGPSNARTGIFLKMVSMNCWNLIKIDAAVFEKIATLFWGPIWSDSNFGAGILIFTGHRPMMNETSGYKMWIKSAVPFRR
jgi:hypothetical protein